MLRFSMKLSTSKLHVVDIDKEKNRKFRKGYKNIVNILGKKWQGCRLCTPNLFLPIPVTWTNPDNLKIDPFHLG